MDLYFISYKKDNNVISLSLFRVDLTIDILSQISSKRFATSTRTARIRSDEFGIRI